jgi:hypothetical protein
MLMKVLARRIFNKHMAVLTKLVAPNKTDHHLLKTLATVQVPKEVQLSNHNSEAHKGHNKLMLPLTS